MERPPIAAIVLAAGMGTRMKSDLHKVLHPIAGRPMLLHLIDSVQALGPARIVVVAGARREQVEAAVAPLGVTTALQAEQLGTGHAVQQAQDALGGFAGDAENIGRHLALIAGTSSCVMAMSPQPRPFPGVWGPYYGAALPEL